jgi:excisionase family DNA binding protein
MSSSALLTIDQAARLLAVSTRTLRREIAAGSLPTVEIRGATRIDSGAKRTATARTKGRRWNKVAGPLRVRLSAQLGV